MAGKKFRLTYKDETLKALVAQSSKKTLAVWAKACAEHVLPYFETAFPDDRRPRQALETLQDWINTGEFHMNAIRRAALDAHAAAREVAMDSPARSAARAAGQAVATAHVKEHALATANYALQCIFRANLESNPETAIAAERTWQYQQLLNLQYNKSY
jgi:hypothetical protein